jgi:hypothetical protein
MLGSVSLAADVTYEESSVSSVDLSNYMPALFDYPYGRGSEFDSGGYVIATFDPTRLANFHVYIKGGKMARVGALASVIYDLERGTVTSMDWRKRTFSVLTFAQMEQQIEKGPRCGENCRIAVEDTGDTAKIDGVEAREYRISAFTGAGDNTQFLAHANYWTVASLPSEELAAFVKSCARKFGPEYAEVCALTTGSGFGAVEKAAKGVEGYVVARVVETRSRAAGYGLPRYDSSHAPWNVNTGPTPAQIRRTETRISNVVEGPVSDAVFEVPQGYRQIKGLRRP